MRIIHILLLFFSCSFIHAQTAPWFRDDFNSNEQNWNVDTSINTDYFIRNGHYILINKNTLKKTCSTSKNIYINPVKDFTMEVKLKIPANNGNGTAGIFINDMVGYKCFFSINPYNNSFSIGLAGSKTTSYCFNTETGESTESQQTNAFTSATDYQVLKLQKKSDSIYFYINDQKAFVMKGGTFGRSISKYIGFITTANMVVDIDYVFFDQENWQDVRSPDASPITATRLPTTINTYASEISPVLSPDKKTLYFTRIGHNDNYPLENKDHGPQDGDIYYSEYKDSAWTEAQRLEYGISNGGNNGIVSMAPDGNSILLYGGYYATKSYSEVENGLAISHRLTNGWSYPQNVAIKNFYTVTGKVSYFLADNGRVLILCFTREGGEGNGDLYVSFKQKNNIWSEPKHMGNKINTPGNDFSPFLSADNKTLYYATSELPGYGNVDTYITKRLDDSWTNWSAPVNLGPAINNEEFNAYYKISTDASLLYYSSTKNTIGHEDIFMAELPEKLSPQPVTMIKGRVLDAKTKLPISATIYYENLGDSSTIGECHSTPLDGSYAIVLPYEHTYGYYAQADRYISINENIDLQEMGTYKEIYKDIYLVPIEVGQTISLNNIFFVRSKAELLPASYPELNRLVKALQANPSIIIEIRGYTDAYGDPQLNQLLSEERVKVVTDYLIKNGIHKSRIKGKGFGGSQPIAPNDTEANREKNRRVEFVIIKK